MISLVLKLEGDGAFSDLADAPIVHLANGSSIEIAALERGMTSGKTSLALRFRLPDGTNVIAETSLALFLTAAAGLRARFEAEAAEYAR